MEWQRELKRRDGFKSPQQCGSGCVMVWPDCLPLVFCMAWAFDYIVTFFGANSSAVTAHWLHGHFSCGSRLGDLIRASYWWPHCSFVSKRKKNDTEELGARARVCVSAGALKYWVTLILKLGLLGRFQVIFHIEVLVKLDSLQGFQKIETLGWLPRPKSFSTEFLVWRCDGGQWRKNRWYMDSKKVLVAIANTLQTWFVPGCRRLFKISSTVLAGWSAVALVNFCSAKVGTPHERWLFTAMKFIGLVKGRETLCNECNVTCVASTVFVGWCASITRSLRWRKLAVPRWEPQTKIDRRKLALHWNQKFWRSALSNIAYSIGTFWHFRIRPLVVWLAILHGKNWTTCQIGLAEGKTILLNVPHMNLFGNQHVAGLTPDIADVLCIQDVIMECDLL